MSEKVRGWMFDEATRTGRIAPAQQEKVVEMLMGMTDEQVTKVEEFVGGQPAAIDFGEEGTAVQIIARMKEGNADDKADRVAKLAEKYERYENMEWKEAFLRASEELGVK